MKSMRLSDLRKRSNKYFRNLGNISSKTSNRTAEYVAKKSYEALPKKLKEFVSGEEKDRIINVLKNSVKYSGEEGINVYEAIKEYATRQRRKVYSERAELIWREFKIQESSLYSHYNTYVYRLGYSASRYWFENTSFSQIEGSLVKAETLLPSKNNIYSYTKLVLSYDFSGGYFAEAYMY